MCTLVVARNVFPGHPLVVAANRDELYARPAEGPSLWSGSSEGAIPLVAPKDLSAGGTWIGLSARGVLAAVTNRRGLATGERMTRGRLVIEALSRPTAADAAEHIASLPGDRFDGFHLVMVDAASAHLVWGDGTRLHRRALAQGLSVITQAGFEGDSPRDAIVRARMAVLGAEPPSVEGLRSMLTVHASPPLDGTCVHADEVGYGTRSSTLFALAADGRQTLHWTEGRPCTNAPVLRTDLIEALSP